MEKLTDHIYILATLLLTAYGQIVMKGQAGSLGTFPTEPSERFGYLVKIILNPWITSALAAAFLGMFLWVIALSKFRLSYAYPFTSITFVLVTVLGSLLFREHLSRFQLGGVLCIIAGIFLISRG